MQIICNIKLLKLQSIIVTLALFHSLVWFEVASYVS